MNTYTHEQFVLDILALVRGRLNEDDRATLDGVKLVYGAGRPSTRGVTYYNAWTAPGHDDKRPLIGLRRIKAAGTDYVMSMIVPELREAINALPALDDGAPETARNAGLGPRGGLSGGGCSAGVGTRGGKSRGAGSGSRMIKMFCETCGYICRASRSAIDTHGPVHCPEHGAMSVEGAAAADCCAA